VKLTGEPAHILVALATTITEGLTGAFIVMAMVLEGTKVCEAQVIFEFMITCTASPLLSDDVEKTGEFVPVLIPLICH
jgi:hypothetical protein